MEIKRVIILILFAFKTIDELGELRAEKVDCTFSLSNIFKEIGPFVHAQYIPKDVNPKSPVFNEKGSQTTSSEDSSASGGFKELFKAPRTGIVFPGIEILSGILGITATCTLYYIRVIKVILPKLAIFTQPAPLDLLIIATAGLIHISPAGYITLSSVADLIIWILTMAIYTNFFTTVWEKALNPEINKSFEIIKAETAKTAQKVLSDINTGITNQFPMVASETTPSFDNVSNGTTLSTLKMLKKNNEDVIKRNEDLLKRIEKKVNGQLATNGKNGTTGYNGA